MVSILNINLDSLEQKRPRNCIDIFFQNAEEINACAHSQKKNPAERTCCICWDQSHKPNQSTLHLHLFPIVFPSYFHEIWIVIIYTSEITGKYLNERAAYVFGMTLSHISYLDPSWYFLSKEVLREMAACAYWNICWPGEGWSGPWVGETRDSGSPWGTWVILCQPGPAPRVLYSMTGTRYSSEAPLKNTNYHGFYTLQWFWMNNVLKWLLDIVS